MKHLVYIHIIVIGFSALTAYFLFYNKNGIQNPFIEINKKNISKEEYEKALNNKPYYLDNNQFLDQFIEKEILIQEAIKNNLHQNEDFKIKIKSFYEKNLVQLLMEKKFEEFSNLEASEDLISKYKKFLSFKIKNCSLEEKDDEKFVDFKFVPNKVKYEFIFNEAGEVRFTDENLNKKIYTLSEMPIIKEDVLSSKEIFEDLVYIKSTYLWNNWLNEIKAHAKISISEKLKESTK
jgi:hypothetical protein